jgi:hypothetical protein
VTVEMGKPLYNPVRLVERHSGNQTYFTIENTSNLNFYEFVSDQYATVQWDHNFGVFSPEFHLCETELRNHGVRGVYGTISDANRGINASGLQYMAPENVYWEYSGIGNIFKVFRIDFA